VSRRIGILGGSFDPVHYGHLIMAERARVQCRLEAVWFLPTSMNPLKQDGPSATPGQRVEMLELAIGGHDAFEICRSEIDRDGPSYTYETLEILTSENPDTEFVFIMGADSLADLRQWKNPERICELVSIAVVCRPDSPQPEGDMFPVDSPVWMRVDMPLIGLSSRELRSAIAKDIGVRFQTPRAVEAYISQEELYR